VATDGKVVRVEVLHLDKQGYGPNGVMTRSEWRKLCLEKLNGSATEWISWQETLQQYTAPYLPASFSYRMYFDQVAPVDYEATADANALSSVTLDFVGVEFLNISRFYRSFEIATLFCASSFKAWVEFFQKMSFVYVSFKDTIFEKDAVFPQLNFKHDANFIGTSFLKSVAFDGSRFEGKVWFNESSFVGNVTFGGVQFDHNAVFLNSNFNAIAGFGGAIFKVNCIFEHAKFASETWFEGVTFSRGAHFEGAAFKIAPTFLSVAQQTVLLFSSENFEPDVSDRAIVRFNYLKLLSESAGQAEQALKFNALELHAKRHSPTEKLAFKCGTWLYEKLSDYGRSFARPLIWYLGLLATTWLLAIIHVFHYQDDSSVMFEKLNRSTPTIETEKTDKFVLSGYRAASEYTVYRAVGVLDFADDGKKTTAVNQRLFEQPFEPPWMRAWGIFKAVFSTALLFLVALGLRNRYRLK
jgi:hypothetical protein